MSNIIRPSNIIKTIRNIILKKKKKENSRQKKITFPLREIVPFVARPLVETITGHKITGFNR